MERTCIVLGDSVWYWAGGGEILGPIGKVTLSVRGVFILQRFLHWLASLFIGVIRVEHATLLPLGMHCTVLLRLPLSTLAWKVLARCSGVVSPLALDRLACRSRRVISERSWCPFLFQGRVCVRCDGVTPLARWSINWENTINRSPFHFLLMIPSNV